VWLIDFLLPTLNNFGFIVITKDQKHILETNAKAMAHAADTHKAEEERLRTYVRKLEVHIARAMNLLGSELEQEDIIEMVANELHNGLHPNAKVREDGADLTLPGEVE